MSHFGITDNLTLNNKASHTLGSVTFSIHIQYCVILIHIIDLHSKRFHNFCK